MSSDDQSMSSGDLNASCRMKIQFEQYYSNRSLIEPSNDEDVDSLIGLPSLVVRRNSSDFYYCFSRCPVTLQLANIKIKCLSEDANAIDYSFVDNANLSQWLAQHAEHNPSIKLHVSGDVCGKLAEITNKCRMTKLSLSFECSLSMCSDEDDDMIDTDCVRRVLMEVDDESLVMRALLKLTDAAVGIPMVTNEFNSEGVKFGFDESLCPEITKQSVDANELSRYHNLKQLSSSMNQLVGCIGDVTADNFSPPPFFIGHGTVMSSLTHHTFEMIFDNADVITKLNLQISTSEQSKLSTVPRQMLERCLCSIVIEARNGEYVEHKSTTECDLSITWQKDEAPSSIWALKETATPCKTSNTNLVAWEYHDDRIIFRQRCLDNNVTSEDVTVVCYLKTDECGNEASCTIETAPAVTPFVFDKVIAIENQTKAADRSQPSSHIVEPMMSIADRFFPTLKMDDSCSSNVFLKLHRPHSDVTWSIEPESTWTALPASCNNVEVFLGYKDRGSLARAMGKNVEDEGRVWYVKFDEDSQISIEQILHACGQSSIIPHIPIQILNSKLHHCDIRIHNGEMRACGKIGSKFVDRFLLLHYYNVDAKRPADFDTFVKVHDKQLFNGHTFPALEQYDTSVSQHCFVYLQASQPISVNKSLNDHILNSEPDIIRPSFSEFAIIPVGSHLLTTNQQKLMKWTPALSAANGDIVAEHNSDNTQPAKRAKLNNMSNSVNKYNIPLALLTDSRSSTELAQYVFEFLDMFDVLFGINMLERARHSHGVLLDGEWWKRRLTHELGSKVTRWSDDVLQHWQKQWLDGTPCLNQYQDNNRKPVSDAIRQHVLSQPLWFTAALHLATRIRTFACDILCHTDGPIRMPTAMRYALTVTPPFQLCTQYLMRGVKLWSRSDQRLETDDLEPIQHAPSEYLWFATTEDAEENTKFNALYTGPTYVMNDESFREAVEVESGSAVRLMTFTDPDMWPVVEWEFMQRRFYAASSLHQYLLKRGAYRYYDKLHTMWDQRATNIVCQSADPVRDEHDFRLDESDNDDDDDECVDPHPSLAPSILVRFSKPHMKSLIEEQFDEEGIMLYIWDLKRNGYPG